MLINEEEFLRELLDHVKTKYKTRSEAAKAWGVSKAYACAVVAGRKPPNQAVLDDIGYVRTKVALYESKQ